MVNRRQTARSLRLVMCCACLVLICLAQAARGQNYQTVVAEGYITAVEGPNEFNVNGREVLMNSGTSYGEKGAKITTNAAPGHNAVQVGAWVQVWGIYNGRHKPATANTVLFRDDRNTRLAGMAVIVRVIARGAEPVFAADGYRIRITRKTATDLRGTLKNVSDVEPNTWLRYEGKRDAQGNVVATEAELFPPGSMRFGKQLGPSAKRLHFVPPQLKEPKITSGSIELGMRGHSYSIPADAALQSRIQRIGMRLLPEYQKRLATNDPAKIDFRFYAIDDRNARWEICTVDGVILMPTDGLKRLTSDDQIAAVLADGIAYELQGQSTRLMEDRRMLLGAEVVGMAAGAFVPGLGLATDVGVFASGNEINRAADDERARIALALMADAGFDPGQAPEVWRLLTPKKLPKNLESLRYPDYASYQMSILRLQYGERAGATAQSAAANAETNHN